MLYEPQVIPSGSAIKTVEAAATEDILFCVSVDSGTTWQYYGDTAWQTAISILEGMTECKLKTITEDMWAKIAPSRTYQIRCVLPSATSSVYRIVVKYI